ncbi:hypothetical protein Ahia01_000906300 [Argonauta hians]
MNGVTDQGAEMTLRAMVHIEPMTACSMVMRVTDATLTNPGDSTRRPSQFSESLSHKPLKFSFEDGKVTGVCPSMGEPTWVLNVKKGILSAFQNSMDYLDRSVNVTETDVAGRCLTQYTTSSQRGSTTIKKSKDLLSCEDRESYKVAIQSVKYNVPSSVQSLPLLKSSSEGHQVVQDGILQRSETEEFHVFRPFSNGDSGATTRQTQTLTFASKTRQSAPSQERYSHQTSLLFQHEHSSPTQSDAEQKILAKLQHVCRVLSEGIRPEMPSIVNDLIDSMREADSAVLHKIHDKISRISFCQQNVHLPKKYFLDAIPMVGSSASVQLIHDLISQGHVTGADAHLWLLSLSFIHHPTREMVAAVTPLLDMSSISGNTILAVSSLASSYCNARPSCGSDYEIEVLVGKLMRIVGSCDRANPNAVHALRALGNIGHTSQAVSRLSQCLTNKDNPMEIRISAIDAFRRIPCDAERSDLMGIFRDESEDSEIRITAYLALMKCPTEMTLINIKTVLEKETSNQVGSFVWSHLTNLRETSDPHLQKVRAILEDETLIKEFNMDQRKFSRNYEGSFMFESLNTGAKVDSNVIFSSKSFVPRSANLNLTVDLFGHAVNVLEIGGRLEGVERILEKFLSSYKMSNMPKDAMEDKVSAALYLRLFGNELYYQNQLISNPLSLFNNGQLMKNVQLLDSRIVVPTAAGLPLNLSVTTTGGVFANAKHSYNAGKLNAQFHLSAAIQVSGEMCVDATFSKTGLKMVTKAHTSSGVQVYSYKEKVQLKFPKTNTEFFNLKTEFYTVHGENEKKQSLVAPSTLHQSKVCSGETTLTLTGLRFCQELQYVDASKNTVAPFFPFSGPFLYEVYMVNEDAPNNYVMEISFPNPDAHIMIDTPGSKISRKSYISYQGDRVIASVPWRNLFVKGVYNDRMVAAQVHFDDKVYKAVAKVDMDSTKSHLKLVPTFDLTTPNHQMSMKANLDLIRGKNLDLTTSITGSMVEPITLKASGQNVPKGMAATSVLKIGNKEYSAIGRVGRMSKKSGFKYSPYLKVTVVGRDVIEFDSDLSFDGNNKASLEFSLSKVFSKPVSLSAVTTLNIGKFKNKHTARVTFKSPKGGFKVTGDMDNKPLGVSCRIIASYNFGAKYSDRLTLSTKSRTTRTKNTATYSGSADLNSKKNPSLNVNAKGKMTLTGTHLDTSLDLYYGQPKFKAVNNLKVNTVVNYKFKPVARECNLALSVKHPGQKVNFQVKADHFHTNTSPMRKIENNLVVQLTPKYLVKTGLFYSNVKVKGLQNTDMKVSLAYPGRTMEVEEKFVQLNNNAYENIACVQWQTDRMVKLLTTYKNTMKMVMMENVLDMPDNKQAKMTTTVNKASGQYKLMSELHVDKDVVSILREDVNYKIMSSVKYSMTRTEVNGEGDMLLQWGEDRKIIATGSFMNVVGRRSTTKLSLTTPFRSVQSYSETLQQVTTAKKCSYSSHSVLMSNNKRMELKQDFSYNSADNELDYAFNCLTSAAKTEVKMSLKNGDVKKTAMVLVKQGQQTFVDVLVAHNVERNQINSDANIMINILDAKTHTKLSMQSDDRETTSNGNVEINLPNYGLDSIEGSYLVKHNQGKSSMKLGYSTSMRDYRNGEISASVVKALPRRLKGSLTVSSNDNTLVKMDSEYSRVKDNYDVSGQLTGPDGKKMTAAFNINLSGARKTSHAEIKSGSIDAAVDGTMEFEAGRHLSGDIRIGSAGKSLFLAGNYNFDSSAHRVNVNLDLPDNRKIKSEATFVDGDRKTFTFNVDSAEFPALTNIYMSGAYEGDYSRDKVATVSFRVSPYLQKLELKATHVRDNGIEVSAELETSMDNMRQAKAVMTLEGDWTRTESLNFRTEFNGRKMFVVRSSYKVNSIEDIQAKMTVSTSHRTFDEFSFDLSHKGDLTNMDSSLQVKAADRFLFNSHLKNNMKHTQVSSKIKVRGYENFETQFVRNGQFDDMVLTLSHKIGSSDQYTCDVSIHDYGKQFTLQFVAPRGLEKFNAEVTIDPETLGLDLELFLQSGSNDYKFVTSYDHLSKFVMRIETPTSEFKIMTTLTGTLKTFKYKGDVTLDSYKYHVSVSNKDYFRELRAKFQAPQMSESLDFTVDGDLENFNMAFSAKHNEDMYQLKASNKLYYQIMNFEMTAPQLQASMKMDNTLKNIHGDFSLSVQGSKYEVNYYCKNFYEQLRLAVSVPKHDIVMKSSIDSKKNGVLGDVTLLYNKKKFTLGATYKNFGRKMVIKSDLKTPYFNDDLTLTIAGKLKKFNVVAKLQHNKQMYELTASNKAYFKSLDFNLYWPGAKAKLDFEGELKRFKVFAGVTIAKEQYKLVVYNQNYFKGISAELNTPQWGLTQFKFDCGGNSRNFYVNSQILRKKTEYSVATSVNMDGDSYSLSLTSPLISFTGNTMNGMKSSNVKAKMVYNSQTYELAASNEDYLNFLSLNMTTPQLGSQKFVFHKKQGHAFSVRYERNAEVYHGQVSVNNKDIMLEVSSPNNKADIKARFNRHIRDFNINANLDRDGDLYKLKAINDNFRQINVRVVQPGNNNVDILIDNTGNLDKGKNRVKASFGDYVFENSASIQRDYKGFQVQLKPQFKSRDNSYGFNFDLQSDFQTKEHSQSLSTQINGQKTSMKTYINLSRGLTASFDLDSQRTGDVHIKINVDPMRAHRMKATLIVKSQATGELTFVHRHDLSRSSFECEGHIEAGNAGRVAGYDLKMTSYSPKNSFTVKVDYDNERYVVTSSGSHDAGSRTVNGLFKLKTPMRAIRDLTVSMEIDANKHIKGSISLPTQYYSAAFTSKSDGFEADLELQFDRRNPAKQYKTGLSYLNNDYRSTVSRKISLKLVDKDGPVATTFHLKQALEAYTVRAEYSWGEKDNQKLGFEVQVKLAAGKHEALLSLILPSRTVYITGSVESRRQQHTVMFTLSPDAATSGDKIEIKADVSSHNNVYIIDTITKFPNQRNGMRVRMVWSGPRSSTLFTSRLQISADQEQDRTLTFDTKLSETNGNYTLHLSAEQPYSNLAFSVVAHAGAIAGRYNTGVEVTYLTSSGQYKTSMVRANVDTTTRQVALEMSTPKKQVEVTGSVEVSPVYRMSINKKESGVKDMQASASFSPTAKNIHLEMNYDQANPDRMFHMDGEVMKTKGVLKMYRASGQQKIARDGKMVVEMRPASVVFLQLLWNTRMVAEITDYSQAVLQTYGRRMQSLGEAAGKLVSRELLWKLDSAIDSLIEDITPIVSRLPASYANAYDDFARHTARLSQLYASDALYLRTFSDSVAQSWDSMWVAYRTSVQILAGHVEDLGEQASRAMERARIVAMGYHSIVEEQLARYNSELLQKIDQLFQYAEHYLNNGFEQFTTLHQQLNVYINKFPLLMKRLQKQVSQHPQVSQLVDTVVSVYDSLVSHKEALVARHADLVALSHPFVTALITASNDLYTQVLNSYGYAHLHQVLPNLRNKLVRLVKREMTALKDALTQVDLKAVVFDPSNGEISAQLQYQGLITAYDHLLTTGQSLAKLNVHLDRFTDKLAAFNDWTVYDTYYHYRPSSDIKNWVPPFKARATLFGSEHLTTFDGRHLNFKGTCSYVLARSAGNFEIVADYSRGQPTVQSVSITTELGNNIKINNDATVKVNGRMVKLPVNLEDVHLVTEGDFIVVEGSNGYKVSCNPRADLYLVDISGWYFNRVSGLLGTYDNEPSNDMRKADRRQTNDLREFANSWSTSGSCRSQNHATGVHMVPEVRECAQMFLERTSPLRSCFKKVNPNMFYKSCSHHINDVTQPMKGLCDVSYFYVTQCRYHDVTLQLPPLCLKN